jgi:hypothetical protein
MKMSSKNLKEENFKSRRLKTELVLKNGRDVNLYDKEPVKEKPQTIGKIVWGLESAGIEPITEPETPLKEETVMNPKKGWVWSRKLRQKRYSKSREISERTGKLKEGTGCKLR